MIVRLTARVFNIQLANWWPPPCCATQTLLLQQQHQQHQLNHRMCWQIFQFYDSNRVLSRFDLASINLFIRSQYALHFCIQNYVVTYFWSSSSTSSLVRNQPLFVHVIFYFLISKLILNGGECGSQSVAVSRAYTKIEKLKLSIENACCSVHTSGDRTSLYLLCAAVYCIVAQRHLRFIELNA